jgi:hypothetical protein
VITALQRWSRFEEQFDGKPVADPAWKMAHREFHTALISASHADRRA